MAHFPRPTGANPPLLNLPPEALLSELTADYMHAQLCNAALHAFAAENEARMEAMAAARNQIERQLAVTASDAAACAAGGNHGGNHRTRRGRDREPETDICPSFPGRPDGCRGGYRIFDASVIVSPSTANCP